VEKRNNKNQFSLTRKEILITIGYYFKVPSFSLYKDVPFYKYMEWVTKQELEWIKENILDE
jgi:hypothetical protein